MNRRITFSLMFLAALGLALTGCRSSVKLPPGVRGTAIYMRTYTLPPDAVVEFKLVEMTPEGVVTGVVSEQTVRTARRAPIDFDIPYRPSEIRSRTYYGVTCEIRAGDKLLFRTVRPFPVLTHGGSKHIEVLLEPER
jgi:uncharacterized lipoprotein YbaY